MTSPHTPFRSESFALLADAEAKNWWFRARNRLLMWAFKTKIPPFSSYLEIGCGTGFVMEAVHHHFPQAALHGSEYFEEGLVFARTRVPAASFTQLDATTMRDSNAYDAIGAFDVIEHIEDDRAVFANIARALKPSGNLMVTVPQHRWLWSVVDEYACHVRRYTHEELVGKINEAGLTVRYMTSFVAFLLPLMLLSRLTARKESYDPLREYQIPRWLNALLECVMQIEFFLIRCGLRPPIGGSLLVVATKPHAEVSHA